MSEQAPERIWVQPWPNGAVGDCWHNATTETERPWEFNEYTRTDLSQALVAAKLREVNIRPVDFGYRLYIREIFKGDFKTIRSAILVLIDTDHQAALDAVRAEGSRLMDWVTHHHLPLIICKETDGAEWTVVDNSTTTVLVGS